MGSSTRTYLKDGSFVDWSIQPVKQNKWRPHGVHYRITWIQNKKARVRFDNHHGKGDHKHIGEIEYSYVFVSVEKLWADFKEEVMKLGGVF